MKYLMKGHEEETVKLFSESHSRRTRGNRHRWEHGKFSALKKKKVSVL